MTRDGMWKTIGELEDENLALAAERDALKARLAEAKSLLREISNAVAADDWAVEWSRKVGSFLRAADIATVDCGHCHKTFAGPVFCCERTDCPHAANRRTGVTAPAVTCDHFPGQTACEWCHGTGAIDAPTSADDPSCPDCDGEGVGQ